MGRKLRKAIALVALCSATVLTPNAWAAPSECKDTTYQLESKPWTVDGTFEYWFISSSTPSYLNVTNTETAIKESVWNWSKATNNCGLVDDISLTTKYMGRTNGSVEINNDGTCKDKSDGRSETGFGTLPSGTVAIACVWLRFSWLGLALESADIRLNKSKQWWNALSSCSGSRYIVETVLTHERGHIWGLSHGSKVNESGHGNLTMSPEVEGYCQAAETTLGKGDVLGMRALGF